MPGTCAACGRDYRNAVATGAELDAAFDFSRPWEGLPLHCPSCGAVVTVLRGAVTLKSDGPLRAVIADEPAPGAG